MFSGVQCLVSSKWIFLMVVFLINDFLLLFATRFHSKLCQKYIFDMCHNGVGCLLRVQIEQK
ncbi:hypothetical protein H4S14_000953 [Agrobacterium vitis]|nr:hypothetical protein [Agrobacterium vitis]MBE1437222.1 hypothetical protein [Agrobacterium vitis]